ncbi:hypothetical protein ESN35_09845 [Bifidobacterium pullorum subsp. gallinarum]|uniref:Uncharacterized protein n=1 Tax=Bifidobacterium pullorum subsp. gallinarum TaxID=78344 RepID=A0A4P6DYL5_9BIFI|nr:hypothetical protein ESN35_09845 [Bifidobacterium pullorum subsp. gallinarum]
MTTRPFHSCHERVSSVENDDTRCRGYV